MSVAEATINFTKRSVFEDDCQEDWPGLSMKNVPSLINDVAIPGMSQCMTKETTTVRTERDVVRLVWMFRDSNHRAKG
jgi:hypothetical protein